MRAWLRRPSFSDSGDGMAEGAAYARDLLSAVAPDARTVETAGYPVVLGTVAAADPQAPTLLIYGLYDVTPLVRGEWTFDPDLAPVVEASEIGVDPALGRVLLGRGANNHKGPVLACIGAVRAMLEVGQRPAAHLIFVIEGEEEIGSPSMAAFVESQRPLLTRASGAWLPCMQQNSAGTMTLRRAFKGTLFAELECRGGEWGGTRDARHVWAGNSAWIDAPMMRLIRALASLFSDDQRLKVDRLDERLRPPVSADSPEVLDLQAAFAAHPQWEANMRRNLNVSRMLGGRPAQDHLPVYMLAATVNVQGVVGGYAGPGYYTNMPGWARAKLDFRFPPGVTPAELTDLVHAHLDARGHGMVRLVNTRGYAASPDLAEQDDTLLQAARATCQRQGIPLTVWPISNNCCPASLLTELRRLEGGPPIPFSVAGAGHGDRAHAPDEYITVDSVRQLMHWTVDYIDAWVVAEQARLSRRGSFPGNISPVPSSTAPSLPPQEIT